MVEARDFLCYTQITHDLGKRSLPSDHVAIRTVLQHVSFSLVKQLHDAHDYRIDAFGAFADFTFLVGKASRARCASHSSKPWCQTVRGGDRNEDLPRVEPKKNASVIRASMPERVSAI